MPETMNTARWKRRVPGAIIAAVSDYSNDDHAVVDQFLHIAKDVAMAEPITNVLHQEIGRILNAFGAAPNDQDSAARDEEVETIFREAAARQAANDALRRCAERLGKDELIELQTVLGARLDELLSAKIGRLVEQRSLAWAEQAECDLWA